MERAMGRSVAWPRQPRLPDACRKLRRKFDGTSDGTFDGRAELPRASAWDDPCASKCIRACGQSAWYRLYIGIGDDRARARALVRSCVRACVRVCVRLERRRLGPNAAPFEKLAQVVLARYLVPKLLGADNTWCNTTGCQHCLVPIPLGANTT